MNDGEKPSRRSSGMYFLKVGNQVASEGEERSEATGGSWEEKSEATGGRKAYRKYVVCHARFFKIFP